MVRPVSSLGGAARSVSPDALPSPSATENTASERISDPPVLTRSRARSFAHTKRFLSLPDIWMNRPTLKLCDFSLETLSQRGRDWVTLSSWPGLRRPFSLFLFLARFLAGFFSSTRDAFSFSSFSSARIRSRFFLQILHNQGNSPVRGILWRIRFP